MARDTRTQAQRRAAGEAKITLRLPAEYARHFRRLAEAEDCSLGDLIRSWLDEEREERPEIFDWNLGRQKKSR